MVFGGSRSPIVVVISESREPAFSRGDLLLLSLGVESFKVGDIVVFTVDGKKTPVVHRVVQVFQKRNQTDEEKRKAISGSFLNFLSAESPPVCDLLTKGDNNLMDDRNGALYDHGQMYIHGNTHIVGKVWGYIPFLGEITLFMNKNPQLKYVVVLFLGLVVVLMAKQL